jgi:hypothetical protein
MKNAARAGSATTEASPTPIVPSKSGNPPSNCTLQVDVIARLAVVPVLSYKAAPPIVGGLYDQVFARPDAVQDEVRGRALLRYGIGAWLQVESCSNISVARRRCSWMGEHGLNGCHLPETNSRGAD